MMVVTVVLLKTYEGSLFGLKYQLQVQVKITIDRIVIEDS